MKNRDTGNNKGTRPWTFRDATANRALSVALSTNNSKSPFLREHILSFSADAAIFNHQRFGALRFAFDAAPFATSSWQSTPVLPASTDRPQLIKRR